MFYKSLISVNEESEILQKTVSMFFKERHSRSFWMRRFAGVVLALGFGSLPLVASAAPVTYTINSQFASYFNNSDGNNFSHPNGGILTGTLTVDAELSGNAMIVDYSLSSYLPTTSRVSSYEYGVTGNTFTLASSVLSLLGPIASTADLLTMDFGASTLGDNSLSFTASETYYNCSIFYTPYPTNTCAYSLGLAGIQGANNATPMSVNAVPVPAAVWLFASGLLGLVGVARREVRV